MLLCMFGALGVLCGGVERAAATLSHAFTASPPFPDMADDALRLCDLPADLLSRIAYLMACPVNMARTSQACRLLREPCEDAALDRGFDLGYEEFAEDDEGNCLGGEGNVFAQLFRLHVNPRTAQLPPSIDVQSGSLALDILRMDFEHFDPLLCVALNLPEEVPRDPTREIQIASWKYYSGSLPGWLKYSHHPDEEYAVAAALFWLASQTM